MMAAWYQSCLGMGMDKALRWVRQARRALAMELRQLAQTVRLLHVTTALVHQLQRERGLSNLHLGCSGTEWLTAVQDQIRVTDAAQAALEDELQRWESITQPGLQRARLLTDIALALQGLQALPWLRQQVQQRRCAPTEATTAYIRLIQALLSMVFEAADAAQDPDISRSLVALYHLSHGKELAGQERAAGAVAFARGSISAEEQHQLLHLIEAQQRSLEVAAALVCRELASALTAMHQQPDFATFERLRQHLTTTSPAAALDNGWSAPWFAACTARIDMLRVLEERLLQQLRALIEHKSQRADEALNSLEDPSTVHTKGTQDGPPAFFATDRSTAWGTSETARAWPGDTSSHVLEVIHEQARQLQQLSAELEQVRLNLQERRVIERAKGLLMAHHGLNEEQAHRRLRQLAMNQGRRMVEVAQAVLSAAELLATPRS